MTTHHASKKWTLFGGGFEIDPLDNGRYRVTIRCKHHRLNEDYYYANREEIFKSFGSAYDLPLDEGGAPSDWRPLDGEEYPDQYLIDTKYRYPQGSNVPILEFVYETLTSTWTNEIDDQVRSTESGLRLLERSQVARPGTAAPYDEDDVGVETITDGGKTLYLAGFENNSTDRKGIFVTRWSEAGTLSVSEGVTNEGILFQSYQYLGVEGAAPSGYGAKIKTTGNFQGFQTIDVTYWKISGAGNGDITYQDMTDFTMPGIVTTGARSLGVNLRNTYLIIKAPRPMPVPITVEVTYSTSGTPPTGTIYQTPAVHVEIYGATLYNRAFGSSSNYQNYIRIGSGASANQSDVAGGTIQLLQNNRVFGGSTAYIDIDGDTVDPAGTSVILRSEAKPAYKLADGTQYYRKIKVTAQIPSR